MFFNVKKHKKRGVRLTHNGESLTIKEWASRIGIKYDVLLRRLKNYSIGDIVSGNFKKYKGRGRKITCGCETLTVNEWADKLGVSTARLRYNLRVHTIEEALSKTYIVSSNSGSSSRRSSNECTTEQLKMRKAVWEKLHVIN
jgi:hypothetical protein